MAKQGNTGHKLVSLDSKQNIVERFQNKWILHRPYLYISQGKIKRKTSFHEH